MRFEALGPLVARSEGGPVPLPPAQRRLLASLLLADGRPQPIDSLIERMWAESPPKTAERAIHVHLSALRRRIPPIIGARGGGYLIDLEGHQFDVLEFVSMAAGAAEQLACGRVRDAGQLAARAANLWRGTPYPELADREGARGERDRLTELWIATRAIQARAMALQGHESESIAVLRQLVGEQPLNEALWESLARAYLTAGRLGEGRAALATARAVLRTELGAPPGARLRELEQRVERHDVVIADWAGPSPPHNLPLIDGAFAGRDHDVEAIIDVVSRHHLVTLTGPAGIGKSRLAIEVAGRMLPDHPGGTWLVHAPGTRTSEELMTAIVSVIGVVEPVESLPQLYRLLGERRAMIVLDGCDDGLSVVGELLSDRRHGEPLRVLATSRSRLDVPGETVWPVLAMVPPDGPAQA